MSKPKDKSKTKYTYKLEIYFDSSTDNVEFVEESLTKDEDVLYFEVDDCDMFEDWDSDSLDIIKESYEIGEA